VDVDGADPLGHQEDHHSPYEIDSIGGSKRQCDRTTPLGAGGMAVAAETADCDFSLIVVVWVEQV